jgi:hypothetical protein
MSFCVFYEYFKIMFYFSGNFYQKAPLSGLYRRTAEPASLASCRSCFLGPEFDSARPAWGEATRWRQPRQRMATALRGRPGLPGGRRYKNTKGYPVG